MSDEQLLARAKALSEAEREIVADLVDTLIEIEKRRAYEKKQRSLYEYCVCGLGYAEGAAYRRIRAARAIIRFPRIGGLLRGGELSLESIALINPFLGSPDADALIDAARGLRVRELERLIADRCPSAPRRDMMRLASAPEPPPRAPAEDPSLSLLAPVERGEETVPGVPSALAAPPDAASVPPSRSDEPVPRPKRVLRVAFTAGEEFHRLFRRAQQLLRHKYPFGRLEDVLKDALEALIRKKDRSFHWPAERRGRNQRVSGSS